MNERRSGFTLIELLISLAIIALMSGLSFAALNSSRLTANDTRRVGDLKNVQGYLEIYYNKCGHYPGTADCSNTSSPLSWSDLGLSLSGAGIIDQSRFPNDPVSTNTYYYWNDQSNYVLGAKLQTDNKSILKGSYTGSDFSSDCVSSPTVFKYCIHS